MNHSVLILALFSSCMLYGADSIEVTLADLLDNPTQYSGRMVTVHAQVLSGFEEFGLSKDGTSVSVWIAWPEDRSVLPRPS